MQHHIQTLVKHIFHKETLQEVTVNQLQKFIDDYPYSAVGQLLLAKKLHDTGAQNFEDQGGKTSLYFHDPVWAGWLLKQEGSAAGHTVQETMEEMHRAPEPASDTPHFVFNNIETPEAVETPPWEDPDATEGPDHDPVIETVAHEPETLNPEPETPHPEPETPNPEPETAFEPYHTIDYFAALGIKLKPEELAKDKLGQQLKSFTDWLRSMKKVAPAQANDKEADMDDLTSKSIQKIANFSNEAKEIITEAMAEVWAKQGHREKAVAIYEKLSLLNPAKSHYFAARIDALKSS